MIIAVSAILLVMFIAVCARIMIRGNDRMYEKWSGGRRGAHDITLYVSNSNISCAELAQCISRIYPLALIRIVYTAKADTTEEDAINKLTAINENISI